MKYPQFDDKFELNVFLLYFHVDNSVYLWYKKGVNFFHRKKLQAIACSQSKLSFDCRLS
jgi:hypothetical protein